MASAAVVAAADKSGLKNGGGEADAVCTSICLPACACVSL